MRLSTMHAFDALGWCSASLMLLTFLCRDARRLRGVAILANVSFMAYGAEAGIWPVLALHAVLLPLNVCRFVAAIRELSDQSRGWEGGASPAAIRRCKGESGGSCRVWQYSSRRYRKLRAARAAATFPTHTTNSASSYDHDSATADTIRFSTRPRSFQSPSANS